MSVIAAVVSTRDGVVASDGRRFGPAFLECGRLKQPAVVESDHFDKTFALGGGKVIGAFCGLLEFSGRTVAEHIAEIVGPELHAGTRFSSAVERIAAEMSNRLIQADEKEVMPAARTVDLLLVGGERLTRSELKIVSIRFHLQTVVTANHECFCRAGDDEAASAAGGVLQADYVGNRGVAFLETLAKKAIVAGISSAGLHEYGSAPTCGGSTFARRTFYP